MEVLKDVLVFLLAMAGVAAITSAVLLAVMIRRMRKLSIPPEAGFWDTLRRVPLGFVVALDLMDFGLDIFAAPVIWFVLKHAKLEPLRNVAVIEALIPGTQFLPTLTLAWAAARALPPGMEPGWPTRPDPDTASGRGYRTIDAEFRAPS
ncbi:MAG: hypothetical protein K1X71_13525 [Pirellulales bacterium]|nr:hypothetical protein [Pirellulales bacterium]